MDTSEARTEPFAQFLEFHDAFSQQFKASVTALTFIAKGDVRLQSAFLDELPSHWRAHHDWSNVSGILAHATADANRLAIVQIHSALDDFLVALRGAHDRWKTKSGKRIPKWTGAEGEPDEPLWKAATAMGLDAAELISWQPLLTYFRVMRNCIVHASSRASGELVELSVATSLTQLLAKWPKRARATAPRVPEFGKARTIKISHKDVILCLDAARRACSSINGSLLAFLEVPGLVHAAAHHALLDQGLTTLRGSYRTAARAIGHTLGTRYGVKKFNQTLDTDLRRLDILDHCKKRHSQLYRQSVEQGLFKVPHGFKLP